MKKILLNLIIILLFGTISIYSQVQEKFRPTSFSFQEDMEIPPDLPIAKQSILESPFQQTPILPNNNNELDQSTGLAQNILTDTITRNSLCEIT